MGFLRHKRPKWFIKKRLEEPALISISIGQDIPDGLLPSRARFRLPDKQI
jgi:hypothetical protein